MLAGQLELFTNDETGKNLSDKEFIAEIERFQEFGKKDSNPSPIPIQQSIYRYILMNSGPPSNVRLILCTKFPIVPVLKPNCHGFSSSA